MVSAGDPGSSDWDAYLRAFHRDIPNATSESLEAFRSNDGRTSYRLLAETLEEWMPSAAGLQVLDLGCGDGRLTREVLAMDGLSATLSGLDLSLDEIERARASGIQATFEYGNAQAMPFKSRQFDAVLSHFAFMLMVPIDDVVREIQRVLKDDGFFAAAFSRLMESRGDMADLLSLLRGAFGGKKHPSRPVFDERQSSPAGIADLFATTGARRQLSHSREDVTAIVDSTGALNYLSRLYFVDLLDREARVRLKEEIDRLVLSRGGRLRLVQAIDIVVLR